MGAGNHMCRFNRRCYTNTAGGLDGGLQLGSFRAQGHYGAHTRECRITEGDHLGGGGESVVRVETDCQVQRLQRLHQHVRALYRERPQVDLQLLPRHQPHRLLLLLAPEQHRTTRSARFCARAQWISSHRMSTCIAAHAAHVRVSARREQARHRHRLLGHLHRHHQVRQIAEAPPGAQGSGS
jgi:hypothetical protein